MKKILVLSLLIFAGCGQVLPVQEVQFDEVVGKKFHQVGENYFEYSDGSLVGDDYVEYRGCRVGFGEGLRILDEGEYAFYDEGANLSFWGTNDCMDLVDELGESLSDKPRYINNRYGFSFEFLPRFEVDYLPNEAGVVMSRREGDYAVEIAVNLYENALDYESLGDYLAKEYEGYSMEFVDGMAFLNEDDGPNAKRKYVHFGEDYILEAYLKVPRGKFVYHTGGFDDFAKTFKFF